MENILILTNVFSRAIATQDETAQTFGKVQIDHWFNVYGVPGKIHCNHGRNF